MLQSHDRVIELETELRHQSSQMFEKETQISRLLADVDEQKGFISELQERLSQSKRQIADMKANHQIQFKQQGSPIDICLSLLTLVYLTGGYHGIYFY